MIDYTRYGIKFPSQQEKIDKHYKNLGVQEFIADIQNRPYHVFCDILDMSFTMADKTVMQYRLIAPNARHRCQYAVYAALKANETAGNTRMTDSAIAQYVHGVAPENMSHIVDVVKTDELIHYDEPRHLVSFKRTHDAEVTISNNIKQRLKIKRPLDIDPSDYDRVDGNKLTDEQIEALCMVRDNAVCMINGSAGTGKSFTTKAVVDMLEDNGLIIRLLAPTGIAAKVLHNYTNHPASTIHMYLTSVDPCDVILIDEMSMVSVHLLSMLLTAVKRNPRLIFVADNAQLASISCGNIVQDLIDSGIVPRVELTKIFRYNTSGIVTLATDTRHGTTEHLTEQYPDYQFIQTGDDPIGQTVGVYNGLLAAGHSMDDVLVLCPFNKHIGCDAINKQISDEHNKNKPVRKNSNLKIGDKVINIKNDYGAGLVNGDIGYLRRYNYNRVARAHECVAEFDGWMKKVPSLDRLKQAYAISVHRIQGSSADTVILLIDKSHTFFLSKNLLYTAVTRARKKLIIIGDIDSITEGLKVSEQDRRDTWLKELLNEGKCNRK